MTDNSTELVEAVREIRELLRLLAEPAIADRDRKQRDALRQIVGKATGQKARAVMLMDGTRSQKRIVEECRIHQGELSTLVRKLKEIKLILDDGRQPKLGIAIPGNFFEKASDNDG